MFPADTGREIEAVRLYEPLLAQRAMQIICFGRNTKRDILGNSGNITAEDTSTLLRMMVGWFIAYNNMDEPEMDMYNRQPLMVWRMQLLARLCV